MNPVDLLAEAARGRDADAPALVSPEGTLSWSTFDERVTERADVLRDAWATEGSWRSRGVAARGGEVRPITVEADREGILTLLAMWRLGVTPAPLNPRLTDAERAGAVDALAGPVPAAQVVLWTSGSAGTPRGVALGAQGLRAIVDAAVARLGLTGGEWWLCSLSPAHVGGLVLVVRALLTGAVLVAPGRLDTAALVDLFDDARRPSWLPGPPSHVSMVPTQLDRFIAARGEAAAPAGLRLVLLGGAHAPDDLVSRALERRWPVALTYGMTEMTSQVATAPPDLVRRKPGTVGLPLAGVEARVASDGEIVVRGRTAALAYVGTATESVADEHGWYRTGDLGRIDSDGHLWVTGRRSDRIVSGGVTVDAIEVEDTLRGHPSVSDACVVGVPSREWGETVAAAVVPLGGGFDLVEVERYLRARLSAAKRPRAWSLEAELPQRANGKVDRRAVRALFDVR